METDSTNICEIMCNKFICKICLLLNIPRSTASGIITKWKQLGTTATQPQSGRPHKMTERGQHILEQGCQTGSPPAVANLDWVEELDWPAQNPDRNPIAHLWDELERRM
ncbi:unnamed protein product [Staurois parvus]|uniref:Transposase n=1 Tax=Staurois parvus TaxID=386267 RepID=A0ABN9E854_9NEOB|nr:unnamed protein product [Staurois parvus]